MPKLVEVKPQSSFRLWVEYDDGAEGAVDLSDLAGRGVFRKWDQSGAFEDVRLGLQGQISWGEEIELCPDAVYMRLTGKSPEDVFPSLKKAVVDA